MSSRFLKALTILLLGSSLTTCTNELAPTGPVTLSLTKGPWPDTLAVAEVASLSVSVTDPDQQVVTAVTLDWASTDSSVVTVTNGASPLSAIVTSRRPGSATISVKVAQNGFESVELSAPVVVRARGADSLLSVGDVDTIGLALQRVDPSFLAGASVTWGSSDPAVLAVAALASDSTRAVITGRFSGTAQVTATIQNPSGHTEFQLPVTVLPLQIVETPSWSPLIAVTDTATFAVTVQDALGQPRPGVKVAWHSTNETAFSVDSLGVVRAISRGGGELVASVGAAPFQVTEHRAPLAVVELWAKVSAGGTHTCAITATDGTGYCWGNNGSRQLGLAVDASAYKTRPARIVTFHKFTEIAAGASHSCGREDVDNLLCWGLRERAQLGDGLCPPNASDFGIICSASAAVPVTIVDAGVLNGQKVAVNQIAAGGTLTCMVNGLHLRAGAPDPVGMCWGNRNGINGLVLPPFDSTAAQAQAQSNPETQVVAAGGSQACIYGRGFSGTFEVMCAGLNSSGQLGDGTTTDRTTWSDVLRFDAPNRGEFQSLTGASVGGKHACALYLADAVWCWGNNSSGQLGASAASTCGPTDDIPTPEPCSLFAIPAQLPVTAASVSAGGAHTCALTAGGDAWCWGSNSNGQLGRGTIGGSSQTPALVSGGLKFSAISTGGAHTCGVSGGAIYCWGANASGQLGDGTQTDRSVPTRVTESPQ